MGTVLGIYTGSRQPLNTHLNNCLSLQCNSVFRKANKQKPLCLHCRGKRGARASMQSLLGLVYLWAMRCSATATKSVKVFFFLRNLPSSYQWRPMSPPPRMCAIANVKPRSIKLSLLRLKPGSFETSYDPYLHAHASSFSYQDEGRSVWFRDR